MDDDGRSGRWMARGNMGKLTHLEAFLSDDGKRLREWTDGMYLYRRHDDRLYLRHRDDVAQKWHEYQHQVAAMEDNVTWADEPKTLTPQDALRALADGKVLRDKDLLWRLGDDGCIYTKYGSAPWEEQPSQSFNDWHILPDPSQPAEPQSGDCECDEAQCRACDEKDQQAKPRYPLTFEEAMYEVRRGHRVSNDDQWHIEYFVADGRAKRANKYVFDGWNFMESELAARWRIVKGGK